MSDRKAFEKWAKGKLDLQHIGVCYGDDITDAAFSAWQAAQAQAGDGEAVGKVYYTGRGFLDVDWFTSDIPDDALLYTAPPAAVNQQLPEGFTKWLDAFVEVSNASGIEDHETAWTWPNPPNNPEFFAGYPNLTAGDLRELHATVVALGWEYDE